MRTDGKSGILVRWLSRAGVLAALLSVGCGSAVDGAEASGGEGAAGAVAGSREAVAAERAAAPKADDGHVQVLGAVEVVDLEAHDGAHPEPVVGAEVCVKTATATTCGATDDGGRYALTVERSDRAGTLEVRHEGFLATTTGLALAHDAVHSLGLVPEVLAPADAGTNGVVLVRSLVSVYYMMSPAASVQVDASVGDRVFSEKTSGAGWVLVSGAAPGPIAATATASILQCATWSGNSLDVAPTGLGSRAGVVTEMDVVCDVDKNDAAG